MLAIQHVTVYRYARPVKLGTHRLMFRPRDSHDLRLLNSMLTISPPAASVRWMRDAFGNSIALAEFDCETDELRLQSDIVLEHLPLDSPAFEIAAYARHYPFSYAMEEMPDLARLIERHYPDPEGCVDGWARQFALAELGAAGPVETGPMLERMMRAIKTELTCRTNVGEAVQSPVQTLQDRSGSCRDFALLMMEAARSLGFAARFVSGYIYDPAAEGEAEKPGAALIGDGAIHAWAQIYLPGAGWVEFDPSNAIVGGCNLIRVAVARDIRQALPISGTWIGSPEDCLGIEVEVRVSTHTDVTGMPATPEPSPAPTFADLALQPGADKQTAG